jgi:hypothetical protein
MPIVIPTAGEIQRMDHRKRAALAKRIPSTRRELAESLALLALEGLDPFPSRKEVAVVKARMAGSREADQARHLLAAMPRDPDARQHVIDLIVAIGGTTQPREPRELDRGRVAPTGRMTPSTLPVEENT